VTRDDTWSRLKTGCWLGVAEMLALLLFALIPTPWNIFAGVVALLLLPFVLMAIYWRPPKRGD
jgi:hypothetical protein